MLVTFLKSHVSKKVLSIEWDVENLGCWNCVGTSVWSDSNVYIERSYIKIIYVSLPPERGGPV